MKKLLTTLFVFFSPIWGLLGIVFFAVLLDTIFAIYVVVKKYGLSEYKSTKLFNIVVKLFFYESTILFAFLIDKYMLVNTYFNIPFLSSKIICLLWVYIEIKSIDETSMKLGNKSIWVLIKEIVNKGKDLKKDINN